MMDRIKANCLNYGITPEQFYGMYLRQNGLCPLCDDPLVIGGVKGAHIDHDHATQEVRGLLCAKCNMVLGKFERIGVERLNHYLIETHRITPIRRMSKKGNALKRNAAELRVYNDTEDEYNRQLILAGFDTSAEYARKKYEREKANGQHDYDDYCICVCEIDCEGRVCYEANLKHIATDELLMPSDLDLYNDYDNDRDLNPYLIDIDNPVPDYAR